MEITKETDFDALLTKVGNLKTALGTVNTNYTSELSSAVYTDTTGDSAFDSWTDEIGVKLKACYDSLKTDTAGGINTDVNSGGLKQLITEVDNLYQRVSNAKTYKSRRNQYPHYDDDAKTKVNENWQKNDTLLGNQLTSIRGSLTRISQIDFKKPIGTANGQAPTALGYTGKSDNVTNQQLLGQMQQMQDYLNGRPLGDEQFQIEMFGPEGGDDYTYHDNGGVATHDGDHHYQDGDVTVCGQSLAQNRQHDGFNEDGIRVESVGDTVWTQPDGSQHRALCTRQFNEQGLKVSYDRDVVDAQTGELIERTHVDYHYDENGNPLGYDIYKLYPDGSMELWRFEGVVDVTNDNQIIDNREWIDRTFVNPDGSMRRIEYVTNPDGSTTQVTTYADAQGNPTDANGNPI